MVYYNYQLQKSEECVLNMEIPSWMPASSLSKGNPSRIHNSPIPKQAQAISLIWSIPNLFLWGQQKMLSHGSEHTLVTPGNKTCTHSAVAAVQCTDFRKAPLKFLIGIPLRSQNFSLSKAAPPVSVFYTLVFAGLCSNEKAEVSALFTPKGIWRYHMPDFWQQCKKPNKSQPANQTPKPQILTEWPKTLTWMAQNPKTPDLNGPKPWVVWPKTPTCMAPNP